jgi:hypothetical protein
MIVERMAVLPCHTEVRVEVESEREQAVPFPLVSRRQEREEGESCPHTLCPLGTCGEDCSHLRWRRPPVAV